MWRDGKQKGARLPARTTPPPPPSSNGAHGPLPAAAAFMGRNCLALGVSKTSISSKHAPIFRHPATPTLISGHQIPDSQTQTCEARAENGDRGNHSNRLVGGSISFKLLFTSSRLPAEERGRVEREKAICLQVRAKDQLMKGRNQEKNHEICFCLAFQKSKLLVYPNAANVGKSELLAQKRSYAECDSRQ